MSNCIVEFADFLASGRPVNWVKELKSYRWGRAGTDNWQTGIGERLQMHSHIADAVRNSDSVAFGRALSQVSKWGCVKAIGHQNRLELFRLAPRMAAGASIHADDLVRNRCATMTKVYAMLNPRHWTIYDSRVGWALQELVKSYQPTGELAPELEFRIPKPKSVRGHAPDWGRLKGATDVGTTCGYVNSDLQGRDSFVRASEVLRLTAEALNLTGRGPPDDIGHARKADPTWQVYHLEMALFMLGKSAGETSDE